MIPSVGPTELLILLTVMLLLFGAKRIPGLARSLGTGAREFREGISGKGEENEGPAELRDARDGAEATASSGRAERQGV